MRKWVDRMTGLHPFVAPAMIGLVGGTILGLTGTAMGLGRVTKADIVWGDLLAHKTGF